MNFAMLRVFLSANLIGERFAIASEKSIDAVYFWSEPLVFMVMFDLSGLTVVVLWRAATALEGVSSVKSFCLARTESLAAIYKSTFSKTLPALSCSASAARRLRLGDRELPSCDYMSNLIVFGESMLLLSSSNSFYFSPVETSICV